MRSKTDNRSDEAQAYRPWYGLARWKRLRAKQLQVHPLCKFCLDAEVIEPATIVDHVEPHGGDPVKFWSGPFQSLCKPHHDATKQAAEKRGRPLAKGVGADGWPLQ